MSLRLSYMQKALRGVTCFGSNHFGFRKSIFTLGGDRKSHDEGNFKEYFLGNFSTHSNAEKDLDRRISESVGGEEWVTANLSPEESARLHRGLGIERLVEKEMKRRENHGNQLKQENRGVSDEKRKEVRKLVAESQEDLSDLRGFLELNPFVCSGCGSAFQSKSEGDPGYLSKDKLKDHLVEAKLVKEKQEAIKVLKAAGVDVGSPTANEILRAAKLSESTIEGIQRLAGGSHKHPQVSEREELDNSDSSPPESNTTRTENRSSVEITHPSLCICQRCYRLQQYGQVEDELRPGWSKNELLTPARFESLLSSIKETKAVVLCIVDVFDLKGSMLENLKQIAGPNPIVIAANKADLLPGDAPEVRVGNWIFAEIKEHCQLQSVKEAEEEKRELIRDHNRMVNAENSDEPEGSGRNNKNRGHYIRPVQLKGDEEGVLRRNQVHLVSCQSGKGLDKLMSNLMTLARQHGNRVFVMGAANVGKSSFINRLLDGNLGQRQKGTGRLSTNSRRKSDVPKATVSSLPGTTLNFLKIVLPNGISLIDTPGLLNPGQLTSHLTTEELKKVIPTRPITPVTLRLQEGKCVLIGGLAMVELSQGKPFHFSFFVSNDIVLHPTDVEKASEYIAKHLGTLLTPPQSLNRIKELGPYETHEFSIRGDSWKESSCDVVIAGLGWVSVTGPGECVVKVTVPRGTRVGTRSPLLPYEATHSTAKFTGGRIHKKSRK